LYWIKKCNDYVFKILRLLLVAIVMVLTGVTFLQVVLRYVLKLPLPWGEELARYLFVWLTFLGSAAAVRTKAHIIMDLVINTIPVRFKKMVNILAYIIFLAFCGLLIIQGWQLMVMNMGQKSDALKVPMAYPYVVIPLGAFFMAIFLLEQVMEIMQSREAEQTKSAAN